MSHTVVQDRIPGLQKRSLSHSTILVLMSSLVSQAAAALTYLLVARSAGSEEFGRAVAAASLILSAVGVVDFGVSTMITREIAAGRMALTEAFHSVFSRVVVMTAIAVVLGGGLKIVGGATVLEGVVAACMAVFMTVSTGLQGIVRGLGQVQLSSCLGAADKLVGCLLVAAFIFIGKSHSGLPLLLGLTVGPAAVAIFMILSLTSRKTRRTPRFVHPYRGALSFGLTSSVTSVQTLDTTAIGSFAGVEAAGQFGAVSRWVAPLNLIVAAFTGTAFPALSADKSLHDAVKRIYRGYWILGLSWVAAVLTALLSPWVVGLLLGKGYDHSAPVLAFMALATMPAGISQVALTLLQARGDEKRAAGRITLGVVFQLALVSLGSIVFGARGAGAAILLSQSALALVLVLRVWGLLREEKLKVAAQ